MKRTVAITLGAAAVAAATLLSGCSTQPAVTWMPNGMPYHEHPSQDWWHYKFVYHPDVQVYFEPYTKQYYWYADGLWHIDYQLPNEIKPDTRQATIVKTKYEVPWSQHRSVLAQHPCPNNLPMRLDPLRFEETPLWLSLRAGTFAPNQTYVRVDQVTNNLEAYVQVPVE